MPLRTTPKFTHPFSFRSNIRAVGIKITITRPIQLFSQDVFCASRFAQSPKPVRPLGSLHLAVFLPHNSPFYEVERYFSESPDLALGAKYLQIDTVKLHENNVNLCPKTNPHHLPQALSRVMHSTDATHSTRHYRLPYSSNISAVIPL